MDTEFFDDTETILTQTINELPAKEFIVVSDESDVSDVCIRAGGWKLKHFGSTLAAP